MKEHLSVFKIGGALLEDGTGLAEALAFFTALPGPKILVHGGGRSASRLSGQLGIPSLMHEGRRITDAAALEVVLMVYAGLENKRLVAQLQATGCNALGLSGADGNAILARKRAVKDIDYGFAGDIDVVNAHAITTLLRAGFTPVFCAITHNGKGQLLNTNADTIASAIAVALSEQFHTTLYYCFELPGVMTDVARPDSVLLELDPASYAEQRQLGHISGGMIPKLDNCFYALAHGAAQVWVGHAAALRKGTATQLKKNNHP